MEFGNASCYWLQKDKKTMLLYWATFLLLVAINIEAFCDSWPDEKGMESVETVADLQTCDMIIIVHLTVVQREYVSQLQFIDSFENLQQSKC